MHKYELHGIKVGQIYDSVDGTGASVVVDDVERYKLVGDVLVWNYRDPPFRIDCFMLSRVRYRLRKQPTTTEKTLFWLQYLALYYHLNMISGVIMWIAAGLGAFRDFVKELHGPGEEELENLDRWIAEHHWVREWTGARFVYRLPEPMSGVEVKPHTMAVQDPVTGVWSTVKNVFSEPKEET